jgi:hypothetical protein
VLRDHVPPRASALARALLAPAAFALVALMVFGPWLAWPAVGWAWPIVLVVAGVAGSRAHRRLVQHMMRVRAAESICTFARSFPRRAVDTLVVRAVWDAVHLGYPLRAEDRFVEDLGMDERDWDMDVDVEAIAARCGRSLAEYERNPWYGETSTVGGLVRFLSAQPRIGA